MQNHECVQCGCRDIELFHGCVRCLLCGAESECEHAAIECRKEPFAESWCNPGQSWRGDWFNPGEEIPEGAVDLHFGNSEDRITVSIPGGVGLLECVSSNGEWFGQMQIDSHGNGVRYLRWFEFRKPKPE